MPSGSIVQISVSTGGVPKLPIPEALVTPFGIDGDGHRHPEIHGGPAKALLWITSEGISELKADGFPLYAGALGENITTQGIDRRVWRTGQRWRIGQVVIELTKMRTPCQTIQVYGPAIGFAVYDQSVSVGDASSPRWGLGGIYVSVIEPGPIRVGDGVQLLDQLDHAV